MELRPDLARTMQAMRAQRAQWATMAGEPVTQPRISPDGRRLPSGHPTLPAPCDCRNPVQGEDTCVLCGKGLP